MPKREKRVVETSICFMYLSKKLCLCYLFVLFEGLVADQYVNNAILTNGVLLIKICIRTSLLCKKRHVSAMRSACKVYKEDASFLKMCTIVGLTAFFVRFIFNDC